MGSSHDYVIDDLRHHPRICSNCFRIRHYADPIPPRAQRLKGRTQWAAAVTEEWTRSRWAGLEHPPGTTVSEWKGTTACQCGATSAYVVFDRSLRDPLDVDRVLTYTGHLSDTLDTLVSEHHERDETRKAMRFTHDTNVLYDTARHLKTLPDYTNKDELVFGAAVEIACRHGATDVHDLTIPASD